MVLLTDATPPDPTVTNTTTDPPTDGTVWNKDLHDTRRAAIEDLIHSATNPTETPATIIDDVVAGRGNKASLDARLIDVIDADGAFVNSHSYITAATAHLMGANPINFLGNDNLLLWHLGDTAAPTMWTLSGTGAAVERCGVGQSDTTDPLLGSWCAKVTYGSDAAALSQTVIANSGTVYERLKNFAFNHPNPDNPAASSYFRLVGVAALVYASAASVGRISITTRFGTFYSSYHPGDSTWQLLTAISIMDGADPRLSMSCHVDGAASVYFAAMKLGNDISDTNRMAMYGPTNIARSEKVIHFSGNITTGNRKWAWTPRRPGIITDVYLTAGTAPTGQAAIYDLNTWDGAALTSMFSTRPQIANGATEGHAQPDTTYARRCFSPIFTTSKAAGYLVTLDCDQVGSGAAGADVTVTIGYLEFCRPLEGFYNYDTLG